LKTVIILYMLILLTSVASAEIYRWEDANGINFTDDSSSVPEKYLEKPFAETNAQSESINPHLRVAITQQNRPVANQENQAAVHQANLEHHRRAAEAKKQQQINTRDFQTTLQSLAKFIVIWIILGFCLFTIWIVTIVDIARSEFTTPSNKTFWMLLVLLVPLLGMLPYMILGPDQKCIQ
jgi:cation transport ATPase